MDTSTLIQKIFENMKKELIKSKKDNFDIIINDSCERVLQCIVDKNAWLYDDIMVQMKEKEFTIE